PSCSPVGSCTAWSRSVAFLAVPLFCLSRCDAQNRPGYQIGISIDAVTPLSLALPERWRPPAPLISLSAKATTQYSDRTSLALTLKCRRRLAQLTPLIGSVKSL